MKLIGTQRIHNTLGLNTDADAWLQSLISELQNLMCTDMDGFLEIYPKADVIDVNKARLDYMEQELSIFILMSFKASILQIIKITHGKQ